MRCDAVPAESRVSAYASPAAGTSTHRSTSTTIAARDGRRGPSRSSADEGVDGNGDEHQHEVDVRPAEELDRTLRCGFAHQRERPQHEERAEHERRDRVEAADLAGER